MLSQLRVLFKEGGLRMRENGCGRSSIPEYCTIELKWNPVRALFFNLNSYYKTLFYYFYKMFYDSLTFCIKHNTPSILSLNQQVYCETET